MNARPRAIRRRRGFPLALLAAGSFAVHAQGVGPDAPPHYIDRVLESGPQRAGEGEDPEAYEAAGWARSLRLEYSMGVTRGPTESLTRALAFGGYVDTPQYGTVSMQGNIVRAHSDGSPLGLVARNRTSSWTARIDQRALPLEGGWLGNHSIGDINTLVPALGRGLSRIFLPSTPIAGAGGEWLLRDEASINASTGQPGLFSGFDISGFQPSRGRVSTAGGQLRLAGDRSSASRVDGAVQVMQARDAADAGIPVGTQVTSTWSALAWEGLAPWAEGPATALPPDALSLRPGRARAQLSLLQSNGSTGPGSSGGWLDAAWRTQLVQHTAGVFHFNPDLRWGVTTMPGDLRGGYWRGDLATRQWQVGWSVEESDSVTGRFGNSTYASLYGRYQLNLRSAIDSTLSLRRGSGDADSLQLNWSQLTDLGQTRLRGSVLRTRTGNTRFVGVDQTWAMSAPTVWSTAVGWQDSDEAFVPSPLWTWAVLASTSPISRLTVEASLHGARGGASSALFANVGLSWQFTRDWAVGLRYTEARGEDPQSVQVVSALTAATQAPPTTVVSSRALQVTLRYETRAGTVPVPLGGTRTSGAGSLSGTVFLDADHSGRREASEAGVPNVTVVLDGKFVTRTDASGRYEFPSIVAGEHTVQVQPDNVPLPWSPARGDAVKVQVLVRGAVVEDFAMQRER